MGELALIIEPDQDEPSFAGVYAEGTVAGRAYRFLLDTGAARTRLATDQYTGSLPVAGADSPAGAFGGRADDSLVTVTDLVAGPLRAAVLDVGLRGDGPNLLGMDVLGQHCCVFRLDAGVLVVDETDRLEAGRDLLVGEQGRSRNRRSGPQSRTAPGRPAVSITSDTRTCPASGCTGCGRACSWGWRGTASR